MLGDFSLSVSEGKRNKVIDLKTVVYGQLVNFEPIKYKLLIIKLL